MGVVELLIVSVGKGKRCISIGNMLFILMYNINFNENTVYLYQ